VHQVCRLPAAALGLLQHSQQVLAEEAFYSEEKLILVLPNHLSVLHRVACEQPGLIPQVRHVLDTQSRDEQTQHLGILDAEAGSPAGQAHKLMLQVVRGCKLPHGSFNGKQGESSSAVHALGF